MPSAPPPAAAGPSSAPGKAAAPPPAHSRPQRSRNLQIYDEALLWAIHQDMMGNGSPSPPKPPKEVAQQARKAAAKKEAGREALAAGQVGVWARGRPWLPSVPPNLPLLT